MSDRRAIRAAVIFDNFGPYHLARLGACARLVHVTAIQVCGKSADYAWTNEIPDTHYEVVTLFPAGTSREVQEGDLQRCMEEALERCQPAAVFIPGWSGKAAFFALSWCIRRGVPAIPMSESTEWDEPRKSWKEWVKRRLVGMCSAAFAGGHPHADYMVKLGMPAERVFQGYDAVDNDYFATQVKQARLQDAARRAEYQLPENYFLASARFIEKKNLPRLMEAYSRYRKRAESLNADAGKGKIWDLVLLGDGSLRQSLEDQIQSLNLSAHVHMPGFKQYPDLPTYYGCAQIFIHASTTEQWGLVVNEAMASGLPVLVSNRCGCAQDLVQEGLNGFTFDPLDIDEMSQRMAEISVLEGGLPAMGAASQRIIAEWGPERFASGLKEATEKAMEVGAIKATLIQRLLLKSLLLR